MTISPQLSTQEEIAELQSHIESLKSKQQHLESEIKEVEARRREQERLNRQQQQQLGSSSGSQKSFDHQSFLPPMQISSLTRPSSTPSSSKVSTSTPNPFGPDPRSAGSSSSRSRDKPLPPIPPSDRDDSILEAMRLLNEFDKEDRALSAQRADLTKSA
jgi:TolA-binding protein